MIDAHSSKTILFGQEMEIETEYEWDDGYPILYKVELIRQVATKGQIFYDAQGKAHRGPAWKRLEITDFLAEGTIRSLADEICENATVQRFEDAADRAMERFIYNRYREPFGAPEPANYTETMREVCA